LVNSNSVLEEEDTRIWEGQLQLILRTKGADSFVAVDLPTEVGWRKFILALEGHEENFVFDPLLYGQPMEVFEESSAAVEVA
jgi:hypothetical protein